MHRRSVAVGLMALAVAAALASAGIGSDAAWDWRHEQRLLGQEGDVKDVAFLDDPRKMVVAHDLARVVIWNLDTGLQDMVIPCRDLSPPRYPGQLRAVVASRDGGRIVVANADHIGVWDGRTGEQLHRFQGHATRPHTVALSGDGRLLAARTDAKDVKVWDLDTGAEALAFTRMDARVLSIALSEDGGRLAVGRRDNRVTVWDVAAGRLAMSVATGAGSARRVDLTADGGRLAAGGEGAHVLVWQVPTGALLATLETGAPVTSVRMRAGGERVVTATGKGPARLWNIETGVAVRAYGHGGLRPRHVRLSPDGRRVAALGVEAGSGPVGNAHGVWMAGTGRPALAIKPGGFRPAGVQLSQDGRRALAFRLSGDATLLDTTSGAELREFPAPTRQPWEEGRWEYDSSPQAKHPFRIVRLLGDGRRVLDISRDGGIVVRDADTAARLGAFGDGPEVDYPCVLSPDHGVLLTGDVDGSAHLWDVGTRSFLRTLPGDGSRVLSASFDAGSRIVVTGSMAAAVIAWNAQTGARIRAFPTSVPGAHAVSVSPDGRRLLTWRRGQLTPGQEAPLPRVARVWDVSTGAPTGPEIADWIQGCVWRPDSRRLYTGGHVDGFFAVTAWGPAELSRRGNLGRRPVWVRPALYYPDAPGRITSATSWVRLVDTPGWSAMLPFDRHHGVRRVAISGDGATVAAITHNGALDIWRRVERVR